MDGYLEGDHVRASTSAREQFYDARGYGHPDDGELILDPVEAAHLLFRGDLASVDGRGFREFLSSDAVSAVNFLVYRDLRERGFYLSPARPAWVPQANYTSENCDFIVYPRGEGPWDESVAYRVRAASERASLPADQILSLADGQTADGTGVLAVVDEESELTFFELSEVTPSGETTIDLPTGIDADLLEDRVIIASPPDKLYTQAFYGQRLGDTGETIHLSLVEGAHLAQKGTLRIGPGDSGIVARGRSVEGERFDRRLKVYSALREAGIVPKTGYKFGADFRTYAAVTDVSNLGHSEWLVRVVRSAHDFEPRDLALDVRMAHGVRKQMIYGLTGEETLKWLSVGRLRP